MAVELRFLRRRASEARMLKIPVLRAGQPYTSLNTVRVPDLRTGEPVVEVSHANPGLVARDLGRQWTPGEFDGRTAPRMPLSRR